MTSVKPTPDAIFGQGFHPKMDPLLRVEADPTTISDNGSLKNHQFRVNKLAKPLERPENVHFRILKLFYRRWPEFSSS